MKLSTLLLLALPRAVLGTAVVLTAYAAMNCLPTARDLNCRSDYCTSNWNDCCAPGGEEATCSNGYAAIYSGEGCYGYNNGDYTCCTGSCADGLCYTLYSGEESPAAAEVKCEERGGHLAKVTTAAQIVAVKNVLKDVPDGNCPRFGAIEEAGSWRWTDGTAVSAIDIIEDAWGDGGHYCSCYWVDDDNVYDAPCYGGWGAGDYYLCATSEEAYTPNPDADWLAFQSWIQPNPMVYISGECTAMYYEEPDGGGYNYRYYTCESDGTINLYSCTCAEVSGHGHGCDGDDDNTVGSLWTVQANVCFNTDDGSYMFSCLDPTAAPTAAPTPQPTQLPTPQPSAAPSPAPKSSSGGNGGADAASAGIIGGAVAGVAVLAAIGVGAYVYMRSKNSADSTQLAEVQLVGSADEAALPKAVASAPPLMPPPPPTGRNFCSACGAPIQGSFCAQCGARA